MTLNVHLAPQTEAWLIAEARIRGMVPADLVRRVIEERAATATATKATTAAPGIDAENAAAIAMLRQWVVEDATDDPEEIRKADEEVQELKRNMNANRAATGERLTFR